MTKVQVISLWKENSGCCMARLTDVISTLKGYRARTVTTLSCSIFLPPYIVVNLHES